MRRYLHSVKWLRICFKFSQMSQGVTCIQSTDTDCYLQSVKCHRVLLAFSQQKQTVIYSQSNVTGCYLHSVNWCRRFFTVSQMTLDLIYIQSNDIRQYYIQSNEMGEYLYYIDRCALWGFIREINSGMMTCNKVWDISFSRRNYFCTTINVVVTTLVVLRWIHIRL